MIRNLFEFAYPTNFIKSINSKYFPIKRKVRFRTLSVRNRGLMQNLDVNYADIFIMQKNSCFPYLGD